MLDLPARHNCRMMKLRLAERPTANPLREQPLFARNRRQTGVQGAPVGHSRAVDIVEIERASGRTAILPVESAELCFGTGEIVVQIDEEGRDALAELLDVRCMPRQARIQKGAAHRA